MRKLLLISSFVFLTGVASADDPLPLPNDFAFLGATANSGVRPFVGYGHQFASHLYSFTQATGTRLTTKPFNIETSVTTGICEVRTLGEYAILGGCLEDGPTMAGVNTGNVVGGTPFLAYRFGKSHFTVAAGADLFHSSLNNASKMQTKAFLALVLDWNRPSSTASLLKKKK